MKGKRFWAKKGHQQGGMALVVTLAILVLAMFAVMAFFSRATSNRTVEITRGNQVLADQLLRSATDIVMADLLAEIASGSDPVGPRYYKPKTPETVNPQRKLVDPAMLDNEIFSFLLSQSQGSDGTDVVSANGRQIDAASWNKPQLVGGGGFSDSSTTPRWIYLNRDGTTSLSGGSDAVGRFAFNVYDVGGLLDVNHVGGIESLQAPFKSSPQHLQVDAALPGLDSSGLRLWRTGTMSSPQIRDHWLSTGGLESVVGGRHVIGRGDLARALHAAQTGLSSLNDPNAGVHVLRHFSREIPAPSLPFSDATEIGFDEQYHFAAFYTADEVFQGYRDDGSSYEYEIKNGDPVLHKRFSLAKLGRELPDGTYSYWLTPTGPGEGVSADAIKAVFGLAWDEANERWIYVSPDGSNFTPAQSIKSLSEVAVKGRPPDFFEVLKSGLTADSLGGSQTLNGGMEVDGDDPPSLGGNNEKREWLRQQSRDLHVLRIGACIIDQADDDNYPTRLVLNPDATGLIEVPGVEDLPYLQAALFALELERIRNPDPGDTDHSSSWYFDKVTLFMVPFLFNPHRANPRIPEATDLKMKVLSGRVHDLYAYSQAGPIEEWWKSENYPGQIIDKTMARSEIALPLPSAAYRSGPKSLGGNQQIIGPSSRFDILRIDSTVSGWNLDGLVPPLPGIKGSGVPVLVPGSDNTVSAANRQSRLNARFNQRPALKIDDLLLAVTYRSPRGQDRVYDTFGGAAPDWSVDFGWMMLGPNATNPPPQDQAVNTSSNQTRIGGTARTINNLGGTLMLKADARTTRYGLFASFVQPTESRNLLRTDSGGILPLMAPSGMPYNYLVSPRTSRQFSGPPWLPPGSQVIEVGASQYGTNPLMRIEPGVLPSGGLVPLTGSGSLPDSTMANIPDRPQDAELVYRPNVAFYGADANPIGGAVPAAIDSNSRPMLLQRPFRNVGELGHVFRDQPWKALGFFHKTSPDLALLDLFALGEIETNALAGRLNINSSDRTSALALFQGVGTSLSADTLSFSEQLGDANSNALAEALATQFAPSGNKVSGIAQGVRALLMNQLPAFDLLGDIKTEREMLVAPLTGAVQSRTWNLLIDVVAQSGRFPGNDHAPSRFVVQGEKRAFVHTAIDRFSGKVVETRVEPASE